MAYSTAAKGKARAIDQDHTGQDGVEQATVHPRPIPATTLLNIEYPGILADDAGPSSSSSSLERALATLHPSALPPLTSSAHEALRFLARIPNHGLRVVECRLGGFAGDLDHVYRAPLIGEAVPTHNIVLRIVRRIWRQKKRKRSASPSTQLRNEALDPALLDEDLPPKTQANGRAERYTGRVKKEYVVEVVGMATHTVRFRSMADFAFQPDIGDTSASSSEAQREADPVMALHRALATMDLAAFERFRVPVQHEDYQLPTADGAMRSNLHMVPPAFFSRMDVPFHYAFQQTAYSELRTVPASAATSAGGGAVFAHALRHEVGKTETQRFVNRVRLSNIAPQPFRVGREGSRVPSAPQPDVLRIEHRCDAKVVARLRELLAERPVWSRVALKNQLDEAQLRELRGNNEKVYYALVGYAMVGGAWRDTVVRFGYDVRTDASSRFYQRIFLRGSTTLALPETETAEEDEEDSRPTPGLGEPRTRSTHTFDGVSLPRQVGNFQLCDIDDPLITPYIWRRNDDQLPAHSIVPLQPMHTPWLRESYDPETGWYTRRALELIRALVAARFKALAESHAPLDPIAAQAIVARIRQRWLDEDASPLPTDPTHPAAPDQPA